MLRFLLANENLPFAIALGLALGLTLVQFLGMIGDGDAEADLDAEASVESDGEFNIHDVLHWIGFGVVPTSALLLLLCTLFGLWGYTIQALILTLVGRLWPALPVSFMALVGTLPVLSIASRLARKFMFREETTAVHGDSLVGGTATITLGAAQKGRPTQGKLKDQHGQTHYVLVEPYREGDVFAEGSTVILVQREGARYFAVSDTVEGLEALERPPKVPAENHAKQSS